MDTWQQIALRKKQQTNERAKRLLESAAQDAYAAVEGIGPWRKLVVVALAKAWPRRFASVAVPLIFCEQLAAQFRSQGFETRVTSAYTEHSRMLSVWLPQGSDTSAALVTIEEIDVGIQAVDVPVIAAPAGGPSGEPAADGDDTRGAA